MGYIKPPPPADADVIFTSEDGTAYTWADHRKMERTLNDLAKSGTDVTAARERLEETLDDHGVPGKYAPVTLVCEYCSKPEFVTHEETCPSYADDLPVTRDAGGYEYLDDGFKSVYITSVPCNDDEALDYFRIVQLMFPRSPELRVTYIKRREMHGFEYQMLPWKYDPDTKEVTRIGNQ